MAEPQARTSSSTCTHLKVHTHRNLVTAQGQSPFWAGRRRLANLGADLARHMQDISDFAEHGANLVRRAPALTAGARLEATFTSLIRNRLIQNRLTRNRLIRNRLIRNRLIRNRLV